LGPNDVIPAWLLAIDAEDIQCLRRFVLASGSLKALAEQYGVSYPTMRARIDRLITRVQAAEDPTANDPFERRLRVLVADGRMGADPAKELLAAHRESVAAARGQGTERVS
jgi:hypothetical protein